MKTYTQLELDNLVKCKKTITTPPKKKMSLENGSYRNNMSLISEDNQSKFSCFMRKNEDFPENFSIGLIYNPTDEKGTICLVRCNGPHGEYNATLSQSPHFKHHIHMAKAENLEKGIKPEKYSEEIDAYASYEEALRYFLKHINVTNSHQFPELLQLKMDLSDKGA